MIFCKNVSQKESSNKERYGINATAQWVHADDDDITDDVSLFLYFFIGSLSSLLSLAMSISLVNASAAGLLSVQISSSSIHEGQG
jgi:hypothetical protein